MIPHRPLLHPLCHIIQSPSGLLIRCGKLILTVTSTERAGLFTQLVTLLDGREANKVLTALDRSRLVEGLCLLEELDRFGLLIDQDFPLDQPKLPIQKHPRFVARNCSVAILADSTSGKRISALLSDAGIHQIKVADEPSQLTAADLWIVYTRGPDMNLLTQVNQLAKCEGNCWLPAFALSEDLITGPIIEPRYSACWRCFQLRWLGMAEAVAEECLFFNHLQKGGWRKEIVSELTGVWHASQAAQIAAAWLAGVDCANKVWITDTKSSKTTTHLIQQHPKCDVCRSIPQNASSSWDAANTWKQWQRSDWQGLPLDSLSAYLVPLFDDRLGLVGHVQLNPLPPESSLVTAVARFAIPDPEEVHGRNWNQSCGIAEDPDTAKLLALIEGLERYCTISNSGSALFAPYNEVASEAIYPPDLPLYSIAQYKQHDFPFVRFRSNSPLSWIWGYNLSKQKPCLIPQDAAYCGSQRDRLLSETSSGVAAHSSRVEALVLGLLELVERDAFMIFWLNRLAPQLLDLATLPEGLPQRAVAEIDSVGYKPVVADLTTDLNIPVILALAIRSDGKYPALLVGAGSGLDRTTALRKALTELIGAVHGYIGREWQLPQLLEPKQVRRLEDHSIAYAHPEWLYKASFLWSSDRRIRYHEIADSIDGGEQPSDRLLAALEILGPHNFDLVAIDLTTPDVSHHGLHVIRALVPGLQPLGFGRYGVRLGGRRLYDAPRAMGYLGPSCKSYLNTDPHCFP